MMEFDLFNLVFTLFPIFFLAVLSIILYQIFKGIKEWSANNKAEKVTVEAILVAKRADVSTHTSSSHVGPDGIGANQTNHSTTYYATFQLANGERLEFHIKSGSEYGLLVEQDLGQLSYQGTRYLSFKRQF